MDTSLPTPMTARVYVNLPEGKLINCIGMTCISKRLEDQREKSIAWGPQVGSP